ncbi:MAG: MFS transporter [Anaerovoracaceae bacterium]|jgi:DHA1 family bicyclomycin/chloramphenicol resistance-like MFS transporter
MGREKERNDQRQPEQENNTAAEAAAADADAGDAGRRDGAPAADAASEIGAAEAQGETRMTETPGGTGTTETQGKAAAAAAGHGGDVLLRQKHMSMSAFIVVLMIITTLQWMTLDMYLPALPVLKSAFHLSEAVLNISLNTGIVCCAIGTLISGTLSDRYGRRGLLLIGLLSAGAASFLAGLSQGIVQLSIMRGIAGLGCGFALTITTAMIKDSFCGRRFQTIMTAMQSVAVIGPIVAPSLGSLLINFSSWRLIFFFLSATTIASAVPIFFSTETWPPEKRIIGSLLEMLRETAALARDRAFAFFLAIMALLTIPVWAYISVSSYVYIDHFHLSNLHYGAFYAVGSIMSLIAPFLYLWLTKAASVGRVVTIAILVCLAGGVSFLTAAVLSPFSFLAGVLPVMIAEGIIRPLGMIVLLEIYSQEVGTASALMQFVLNLVGCVGTSLATIPWHSTIHGIGFITCGCVLLAAVFWALIVRRRLLPGLFRRA